MKALSPAVLEFEGRFTHRYLYTRGLRLHVAEAGEQGAPLVLLLHDEFGNWSDYYDVIGALADQGFKVVAVDFRGFGMSDKPPVTSIFTARTLVSDIVGLIAALGYERAHLVGCGAGGSVGWVMAATHPHCVGKLVSVSAAHPHDLLISVLIRPWAFFGLLRRRMLLRQTFRRLAGHRLLAHTTERITRSSVHDAFTRTAAYRRSLERRICGARINNTGAAMVATSRLPLSLPNGAKTRQRLSADVLMICPDESPWLKTARRARRRLATHASLVHTHLAGTKHLPHIEAPARFVRVVEDFLRAES